MNNKLIIIGNGFDLHSGLKSSFDDFFKKTQLPLISNKNLNRIYNYNITFDFDFISLLLYNSYYRPNIEIQMYTKNERTVNYKKSFNEAFNLSKNLIDWMDVEGFIKAVLTSSSINKLKDCFNKIKNNEIYNINCICKLDYIPEFMIYRMMKQGQNYNDFYDFFFRELKNFEISFKNYLSDLINNTLYREKSFTIFNHLVNSNDHGIILNFNYTSINANSNFKEVNVHGKLADDVIIGIDGKDLVDDELIIFTKTFRKLYRRDNISVLNKDINEIVIYGHSLGEQDYSYFQSIFDYLDIYNSSTIIRFIYSDDFIKENNAYSTQNKEDYKLKITKKLFKLINVYGLTLNNKDNGKNLLHKLVLEGRIKIELNNFDD